jgi:hypothetical protein
MNVGEVAKVPKSPGGARYHRRVSIHARKVLRPGKPDAKKAAHRCTALPRERLFAILEEHRRARRRCDRVKRRDVRFWHKADIGLRDLNVCFGGKASARLVSLWPVEKLDQSPKIRMRQPLPAFLTGHSKNIMSRSVSCTAAHNCCGGYFCCSCCPGFWSPCCWPPCPGFCCC